MEKVHYEGVTEFHITFTIKLDLALKQPRYNANELALLDPCTMWNVNKLPTNDLNRVDADFSSNNCITVNDEHT